MVLILLSMIVAAIAVTISMRRHDPFGSRAGLEVAREDIAMPKKHTEQSRITTPMRQFLVVVLPDGKVVNPMVADRF
jgi:hypothetical protein